jgi:hypothetical protein
MSVLKFQRIETPLPEGWRSEELHRVASACAGAIAKGEASGWEMGATENGDPQVYVLGPPPDYDCILCISRLGRHYVIEAGNGRVVFEHGKLMLLAEQATAVLRRRKTAIVTRSRRFNRSSSRAAASSRQPDHPAPQGCELLRINDEIGDECHRQYCKSPARSHRRPPLR